MKKLIVLVKKIVILVILIIILPIYFSEMLHGIFYEGLVFKQVIRDTVFIYDAYKDICISMFCK